MKFKLLDIFSDFILAMIVVLMGVLFYWSFMDNTIPYVATLTEDFPQGVSQGTTIYRHFILDNLAECTVSFHRSLQEKVSLKNYEFQSELKHISREEVGRSKTYIVTIKVPDNFPPGNYLYVSSIEYSCNPIEYLFPVKVPIVPRDIVIETAAT